MNNQVLDRLALEKSWSRSTLAVYRSNLKTITSLLGDNTQQIFNGGEKVIIDSIKEMDTKSSYVKSNFINLFIIYRNLDDRSNVLLRKYRQELGNNITVIKKENDKNKDKTIIDFTEYVNETNKLIDNFPTKYIIRKLLIELGCRNRDLNIMFVYDKKINNETREKAIKDELNILHIRSKDMILYRKFYKTASTYGVLRNVIKDTKLKKTIKENYNNGSRLIPLNYIDNFSRFIKRNSVVGETDIFKAQIKYYKQKGDLKKIKELSESRGTSLQTVVENYDVASADNYDSV